MITRDDLTTPEAPVLKTRGRGPNKRPTKIAIGIRLDPAVLAAYRASGRGWQRRMQDVIARGARRLPRS